MLFWSLNLVVWYNMVMNNKTTIAIIAGVLVIGGLAWWALSGKGATQPTDTTSTTQTNQPTSVTVNHYFQENNGIGSHTIEGTLTLPTPCHILASNAVVTPGINGAPDQVLITFTTTPGTGVCTQVLADKFFRVTFTAGKDALITATLDGKPLALVYSETKEGITK